LLPPGDSAPATRAPVAAPAAVATQLGA
jgi:hypothetical protein